MLQFIHKLLMLSKKALGTAALVFILAVLCTALVVPVGSLAHGSTVSQAAPHSKLWFKTAMDIVPAPNSSAFRSRYMTDYFARGKSHNQSGEQIIISELHCACTPCRFAKQTLAPPVLHLNHAHLTLPMWDEEFKPLVYSRSRDSSWMFR